MKTIVAAANSKPTNRSNSLIAGVPPAATGMGRSIR